MEIKITHTPEKNYDNCYTIEGNCIESILTECLTRIRAKSRDFYREELRRDLIQTGKSIIDIHAGQKNSYTVILNK